MALLLLVLLKNARSAAGWGKGLAGGVAVLVGLASAGESAGNAAG